MLKVFSFALIFCLAGTLPSRAQLGTEDFQQRCAACHTVGGDPSTGPDLKEVTARRSTEWLVKLLSDPRSLRAKDDRAIKRAHEGIRKRPLTPQRARALVSFLEEQAQPRGAGADGTMAAESAQSVTGRRLFDGSLYFASGGSPCISCHKAATLGDNTIGPDLSKALAEFDSSQEMAAWLARPTGPVMSGLYPPGSLTDEEIAALVAFFEQLARVP